MSANIPSNPSLGLRQYVMQCLMDLGFHFKNGELAELFGCALSTISSDMRALGGKQLYEQQLEKSEGTLHDVRFRAALSTRLRSLRQTAEERDDPAEQMIVSIANGILRTDHLLHHIIGAGECLDDLQKIDAPRGFEGYRRLFQRVYSDSLHKIPKRSPQYYQGMIDDYFRYLVEHEEERPKTENDFLRELRTLVIRSGRRANICPHWEGTIEEFRRFFELVTEKLTPRRKRFLELKFGLDGEAPKTNKQLMEIFDVPSERIHQIEVQALRFFRNPTIRQRFEPFLKTLEDVNLASILEEEHHRRTQNTQDKEGSDPRRISINKADLGVRAYGVCRKLGAFTLGDLAERSEKEVLHTENCGTKTMKELRGVLEYYGLCFKTSSGR